MKTNEIPVDELRRLYEYNPETGGFLWKVDSKYRPGRIGAPADKWTRGGYRRLYPAGRVSIAAHRAAFAYVYGYWPKQQIDHINRNKGDNRIENLRDVSASENRLNAPSWAGKGAG